MSDKLQDYTTLQDIAQHCLKSEKTVSRLIDNYNKVSDRCLTSCQIEGQDQRKRFYLISGVNRVLSFGGYPPIHKPMQMSEERETYVESGALTLQAPTTITRHVTNIEGIQRTKVLAKQTNLDNSLSIQDRLSELFTATLMRVAEQGVATIEVAAANGLGEAVKNV